MCPKSFRNSGAAILAVLFIFLSSGCAKPGRDFTPLTSVHDQFVSACREQVRESCQVMLAGRTLYVYVPVEENIFSVQLERAMLGGSTEPVVRPDLRFIDVDYRDGHFHITYDVTLSKKYPPLKSPGMRLGTAEAYNTLQQKILNVFRRTYLNLNPEEAQALDVQFAVLVVADIKTGVEIELVAYFEDLKKMFGLEPPFPPEEQRLRMLSDSRGNVEIIGDTAGKHLVLTDIAMGDFLARQIRTRVEFKYQQSAFPPDVASDAAQVIEETARATLDAYNFTDDSQILLTNLK